MVMPVDERYGDFATAKAILVAGQQTSHQARIHQKHRHKRVDRNQKDASQEHAKVSDCQPEPVPLPREALIWILTHYPCDNPRQT
jgi:hypothetical protein